MEGYNGAGKTTTINKLLEVNKELDKESNIFIHRAFKHNGTKIPSSIYPEHFNNIKEDIVIADMLLNMDVQGKLIADTIILDRSLPSAVVYNFWDKRQTTTDDIWSDRELIIQMFSYWSHCLKSIGEVHLFYVHSSRIPDCGSVKEKADIEKRFKSFFELLDSLEVFEKFFPKIKVHYVTNNSEADLSKIVSGIIKIMDS